MLSMYQLLKKACIVVLVTYLYHIHHCQHQRQTTSVRKLYFVSCFQFIHTVLPNSINNINEDHRDNSHFNNKPLSRMWHQMYLES